MRLWHRIPVMMMLLLTVFASAAFAQDPLKNLTTKSKKAAKAYERGGILFSSKNYPEALRELETAVTADPGFIEAWLLLGDVNADAGNKENAIKSYKKAIAIDPGFFPNAWFLLGRAELSIGSYEDARRHFANYKETGKAGKEKLRVLDKFIRQCDFAIQSLQHPVPFNPQNMGPDINTRYDDYVNAITADNNVLYLTIKQPVDNPVTGRYHLEEDLFYSICAKGQWGKAVEIGAPINTGGNEGAVFISPDGMDLFYACCNRPDGIGNCDIYIAHRESTSWSVPVNLGEQVNSAQWDSQPTVSSDGRTLYFVSTRKGGHGGSDIWKSIKGPDGTWGLPENLGNIVNTPEQEMNPFIHPDGRTLYFASSGHTGMGGYDLFMTKADENGNWSEPLNLGYPINTWADEFNLIVDARGELAYMSADRQGGYGRNDIFVFQIPESMRPSKVNYVKGQVFDSKSRIPLYADFELIDLATGDTIVSSHSDPVNGEFLVTLPPDRDYALHVNRKGYLFYSGNFALKGNHGADSPYMKDIPLNKIETGGEVILRNIFFETDKWELKEESRIELNKLVLLLQSNQSMMIEIQGHTDNQGDERYNHILSSNRAKVVYEYLIAKGIEAGRLAYAGYGETKPVADNDTEEGRAQNRRTGFKVTAN